MQASVTYFINQSIVQLKNWLRIDSLSNSLTHLQSHSLTHWRTHWLINYLSDALTDSLTDWLIDSLTDWHTNWLMYWLIIYNIGENNTLIFDIMCELLRAWRHSRAHWVWILLVGLDMKTSWTIYSMIYHVIYTQAWHKLTHWLIHSLTHCVVCYCVIVAPICKKCWWCLCIPLHS